MPRIGARLGRALGLMASALRVAFSSRGEIDMLRAQADEIARLRHALFVAEIRQSVGVYIAHEKGLASGAARRPQDTWRAHEWARLHEPSAAIKLVPAPPRGPARMAG